VSLLAEALQEELASSSRARCWYQNLDPADQKLIDKAFADGVTNSAILRSLQKAQIKASKDSVARHRKGCPTCQT